jgi:hypothetical protein
VASKKQNLETEATTKFRKGPSMNEFDLALGLDISKMKNGSQSTRNKHSLTTKRKEEKDKK